MPADLICFSHLRWDFVFQRPNHLMVRAARDRRVFFVEEPVGTDVGAGLELVRRDGLTIVRPQLPRGLSEAGTREILADLLGELVERERIVSPWAWFYTPMALQWARSLQASAVIYDCMDELSAFRGAPPQLLALERELFLRADIVFTGGHSLFEAKVGHHPRVHAMPSSVDRPHFAAARAPGRDPEDQVSIPHPRIGYYGVIDERIDRDLIAEVARRRPDWQLVLVGPVAKLSPEEVPSAPNIHHLGMKPYDELPDYLRGWDVAMMPFARNEATRYISPTKTPEYLAGGTPVVSTPIRDVVNPYGRLDLVRIASTPDEFIAGIEAGLREGHHTQWAAADALLAEMSWDATWARMDGLVRAAIAEREAERIATPAFAVARAAAPGPRAAVASGAAVAAPRAANRRGAGGTAAVRTGRPDPLVGAS